jgi:SNF2 family DNA or RNA helicase
MKELGIFAELEPPGRMERKFKAPIKMVLKKSQVPTFLEEFGNDLLEGPHLVDAEVKGLTIFKQIDRIEITPEALERDWFWLSVIYGFGNSSVSLIEILRAREEGQRYIGTGEGWLDCKSPDLDALGSIPDRSKEEKLSKRKGAIKLSRMDFFRLTATRMKLVGITGDGERADLLKRMLELKPMRPLPKVNGMISPLRSYQERGVEWIWFLFENGLGGLLCDDMGLGKTHEVMAFMMGLREHENVKGPFLVVCPTTVLSHWDNKIREHAPGLKPVLYHGGQRDLGKALKDSDVLLTSYGILRWDIEKLKDISFPLAVFDEIQHIKNPQTLAYRSAKDIKARMKLGLTGTPIENSLSELKALFDLTMPGYFGTDKDFDSRYIKPIELGLDSTRREELSRLISPFTLRRIKETVLDDLPEKIEDIRSCRLSDDQIKLYRDAISSRGKGLLRILKTGEEPVPYIHIFALLNLLKQICNHPAMVEGRLEDYERYQSGKWELFKELITESLDSGQKVVVYSQFLGMIKIIVGFLQTQNVDFVTLTGASRNRGEIISRFNNNPDCRLYVGSLKAGGTGIDLVAASVVIHYDRWWNAAREDQATDRVHRIGQKRGVQVFKLVTEGTLEEKISAIIEKKRNLMDSVVKENDPAILKTFSRDELIDLLSIPT